MKTMFIAASFLFGAAIGSFLNVCIYRLPRRISLVTPRSFCPGCGKAVRWYFNVPVFGWFVLGGKCRECGSPIHWRYPLVEAASGAAALACYILFPPSQALSHFVFISALIVIAFIDLEFQIIPGLFTIPNLCMANAIKMCRRKITRCYRFDDLFSLVYTAPELLLAGLAAHFIFSRSVPQILAALLLGSGVFYAIRKGYRLVAKLEGMGFGDVKLMALFGAYFGNWTAVPFVILFSSVAGTLVGIYLMIFRKKDSRFALPFGPFLVAGALIYLFIGDILINWYLSRL